MKVHTEIAEQLGFLLNALGLSNSVCRPRSVMATEKQPAHGSFGDKETPTQLASQRYKRSYKVRKFVSNRLLLVLIETGV